MKPYQVLKIPQRRVPNGKYTSSLQVYLREWRKIINKIEKMTGLKCGGYDPGMSFYEVKEGKILPGTSVEIPVWLALRLINKFDEMELRIENLKQGYTEYAWKIRDLEEQNWSMG